MKLRWFALCVLGLAFASPAFSQVSVYGELSASKLTGGLSTTTTNWVVGPTLGASAKLTHVAHLDLSGDLRASFLGGSRRLDQISIGPKLELPVHGMEAYGEFLFGFGRYNDGLGNPSSASTDSEIQLVFGVDRKVTKRFDWRVFEFGYEQYYGLGGEYNPKSFSTGVVFHLGS